MSGVSWTAPQIERFKQLWAEGMSKREIGEAIGRTGHAIDQMRNVLKLTPRRKASRFYGQRKAAEQRKPAAILPTLDRPGWPTLAQLRAGR